MLISSSIFKRRSSGQMGACMRTRDSIPSENVLEKRWGFPQGRGADCSYSGPAQRIWGVPGAFNNQCLTTCNIQTLGLEKSPHHCLSQRIPPPTPYARSPLLKITLRSPPATAVRSLRARRTFRDCQETASSRIQTAGGQRCASAFHLMRRLACRAAVPGPVRR